MGTRYPQNSGLGPIIVVVIDSGEGLDDNLAGSVSNAEDAFGRFEDANGNSIGSGIHLKVKIWK